VLGHYANRALLDEAIAASPTRRTWRVASSSAARPRGHGPAAEATASFDRAVETATVRGIADGSPCAAAHF
jgi:hypothetical protein